MVYATFALVYALFVTVAPVAQAVALVLFIHACLQIITALCQEL